MEATLGKGVLEGAIPPISPKSPQEVVESKLIPCEKCGETAAILIFADDAIDLGGFEDCARKMYHQYSDLNVSTWIIGPPVGDLNGAQTPTNTMKVWPQREPIKTITADEFNADLDAFVDMHCGQV